MPEIHQPPLSKKTPPAILEGLKASFSITLGYFPMAFSFGVIAVQTGLSPWQALAVSLIIYSGAAQFILVSMLAAGTGFGAALSAVLMLNIRHIFYGPALATKLKPAAGKWAPWVAFGLTDEVFATAMSQSSRQRLSAPWCFGLVVGAYCSWVIGTAAGAWLGLGLGGTEHFIGRTLQFILPALFIALLGQAFQRQHWPVVLAACGIALAALLWVPVHLAMIAGMVGGAAIRPCLAVWEERKP